VSILLTALFVESGVVLLLAPWSPLWDRNALAQSLPPVAQALMVNNFVRGAVSGLGLVNMAAAIGELHAMMTARRTAREVLSIAGRPVTEE